MCTCIGSRYNTAHATFTDRETRAPTRRHEAGGDRSKVRWAAQPGGGRFTPAATPAEQAAAPPQSHELGPLKSASNTFCQACYKFATSTSLGRTSGGGSASPPLPPSCSISHNKIGETGAAALSKALETNTSLQGLE